ncbi:MAG: hypothetical protein SO253_05990 [Bacilli bacterium]|nr:hypothetical protein [Bacilli bacterium]
MKKLIYLLFMPLFIFISIVGTGFSTWYFLDNTLEIKSTTIPVSIEQYVDVGKIEFVDANGDVIDTTKHPYKLVVDQKRVALNERIKVKYTLDLSNLDLTSTKIKFICSIEFDEKLTKYVEINSPEVTVEEQNSGRYTMTWLDNFNYEEVTYHTSNLFFEYKSTSLPTTEDEYEQTYLDLSSSSISITYKAILEKTAA